VKIIHKTSLSFLVSSIHGLSFPAAFLRSFLAQVEALLQQNSPIAFGGSPFSFSSPFCRNLFLLSAAISLPLQRRGKLLCDEMAVRHTKALDRGGLARNNEADLKISPFPVTFCPLPCGKGSGILRSDEDLKQPRSLPSNPLPARSPRPLPFFPLLILLNPLPSLPAGKDHKMLGLRRLQEKES
jgi:hypothetical protein